MSKLEDKNNQKPKRHTPFVQGNQLWNRRSKHGRDTLYKNAELLWEAACEYFKSVDDDPFVCEETYTRGKTKDVKKTMHKKPYTLAGLCLYLDCSRGYFKEFKESRDKVKHKDFMLVITRIEETIYAQKFEGASAGLFNTNIIARDLGLVDKVENTNTIITVEVAE